MPIALSALTLKPSISLEEEVPAWGKVQAPHVGGEGRIQPGCLVPSALYEPSLLCPARTHPTDSARGFVDSSETKT